MEIKIPVELPDNWADIVLEKSMEKGLAVAVVRCKDCKYNVANRERDELDIMDYTDITCEYFMTDGMCSNDFCSRGEKMYGRSNYGGSNTSK